MKAGGGESVARKLEGIIEDDKITAMRALLRGRLNQLALLILMLQFLSELLLGHSLLLSFLALPAAGVLMGRFNSEIESHILLHSIQLVTLFATLLLIIYASELGGTGGVIFFLLTFPPMFYYGFQQKTA